MSQTLKQNIVRKIILPLLIVVAAMFFWDTESSSKALAQNSTKKNSETVSGTITLNIKEKEVSIKEVVQLTVIKMPEGGKCQWFSNREDIAYVTTKGKVTAKSAGKATITCNIMLKDKKVKTLKSIIMVKSPEVESIKLNLENITLDYNKSKKLSASVLPKNAGNKEVTWKCENKEIAFVSSTGNVTAVSPGVTYVRAYTENGKEAVCMVVVNPKKEEPPKIEKIDFTVNGDFVVGEAKANIEFLLSKKAKDVFIEVLDESNECILTISMGQCENTLNKCTWNGKDQMGNNAKEGNYTVRVNADGRTKKSKKLMVYEKGDFQKGNGTLENPYIVTNEKELNKVRDHYGKYFLQGNDIDMSGTYFTPMFSSRKKFSGLYDGGGYKISNLSIDNGTSGYAGLFAAIGEDGIVKNVHISNCNVIGGKYTAAIAGKNCGLISSCSVTGWIHGSDYAAGICGLNEGSVKDCSAAAIVTGDKIGGIVIEKY